jgi:hypothetical protein
MAPSINIAKVKRKPYTKKWTNMFTFLSKNALEAFSLLYNSDTIFPYWPYILFIERLVPVVWSNLAFNGHFIWETGYWTRAIKRFALFAYNLLESRRSYFTKPYYCDVPRNILLPLWSDHDIAGLHRIISIFNKRKIGRCIVGHHKENVRGLPTK